MVVKNSQYIQTEVRPMLDMADLQRLFKVSRSSVYRWIKQGRFPQQVNVGPNSVAWTEESIMEWRENLIKSNIVNYGV